MPVMHRDSSLALRMTVRAGRQSRSAAAERRLYTHRRQRRRYQNPRPEGPFPPERSDTQPAAGTALLLLVAAEMIAAEQGIGALILHYGDLMITERLMAGVIVLSVLGLIFNLFLQFLERKLVPWNRKE